MTFVIGIYIACEIISNVTANKVVSIYGITVPAAVFLYSLTFTLIDLINERLGKTQARRVIWTAFSANILLAIYVWFSIVLPSASFWKGQEAFRSTLSNTPRIIIASLIAYLISSYVDTEIFARWRERFGVKHKWVRVLVSNTVSLLIDSIFFIGIAFSGLMPILSMIEGQFVVKMFITIFSLPLIYFIRQKK